MPFHDQLVEVVGFGRAERVQREVVLAVILADWRNRWSPTPSPIR